MALARFLQVSDLHLGRPFAWLPADRREERRRDQQRDEGRDERAGDERHDAVARLGEKRRPKGVGQEVRDRHVLEERQGLADENPDDGGGRDDGREPRGEQQ